MMGEGGAAVEVTSKRRRKDRGREEVRNHTYTYAEARVNEEGRGWWEEDWPKAGCGPRAPVALQSYIGTGRPSVQYHTLTVIYRGRIRYDKERKKERDRERKKERKKRERE